MMDSSWVARLEQVRTSYLLLGLLALVLVAAGILHRLGVIAWVLGFVGQIVRGLIRPGIPALGVAALVGPVALFLALVLGFLILGVEAGGSMPGLRIVCGLVPLFMGAIACLAYMFIDLERYEVERGYKAVHNPLKGQSWRRTWSGTASGSAIPLLVAAAVGVIGGFALLNQGLYETVGRDWYRSATARREPIYVDFLAYALIEAARPRGRARPGQVAPHPGGRVRPPGRTGRPRRCSPASSLLHPGPAPADLRLARGRASCWPRRSPTSGARTSRSTSGPGTRCRVTERGHRAAAGVAAVRSRR